MPADLVESLHDLASFHNKDRQRPMLDMSRWRLSQVMKETALEVGIDPKPGPTRTPSGTPTAATACSERRSDPRAAEMAGAPVPQGHAALCGAGRRAPRMGKPAVSVFVERQDNLNCGWRSL